MKPSKSFFGFGVQFRDIGGRPRICQVLAKKRGVVGVRNQLGTELRLTSFAFASGNDERRICDAYGRWLRAQMFMDFVPPVRASLRLLKRVNPRQHDPLPAGPILPQERRHCCRLAKLVRVDHDVR
jgi:hypothetical protein